MFLKEVLSYISEMGKYAVHKHRGMLACSMFIMILMMAFCISTATRRRIKRKTDIIVPIKRLMSNATINYWNILSQFFCFENLLPLHFFQEFVTQTIEFLAITPEMISAKSESI